MRKTIWLGCLCFVLLVLSGALEAGCYTYVEYGPYPCSNGSCYDSYYRTICGAGCVSGLCYPDGGSGECCGRLYYNATIYPDGTDSCGGPCGYLPTVASLPTTGTQIATHVNPRRLVLGPDNAYYKPARMTLVPDTCRHTYAIVTQPEGEPERGL
jgi:hypothetical protein